MRRDGRAAYLRARGGGGSARLRALEGKDKVEGGTTEGGGPAYYANLRMIFGSASARAWLARRLSPSRSRRIGP